MKQASVIKLGLVAAGILLAAVVLKNRGPDSSTVLQQSAMLVPGLKDKAGSVTALNLTGAGNQKIVSLKQTPAGWVADNKSNYPVDVVKLRGFLLKLGESKILEPKTAAAENYSKLGVEDLASVDAKGVQVELAGLAQPYKMIIGNFAAQGGQSVFVRKPGDAQSYLASGNVRPETSVNSWLISEIVNIPGSAIQEVKLIPTSGDPLIVRKETASDENWAVQNVPKKLVLGSDSIGNALTGFLEDLKLEDVQPSAGFEPNLATLRTARYLGFNGLVIEVTGWEQDEKSYIKVRASTDAATSEQFILAAQVKAQNEAAAKAQAEVAAAAAATAVVDPTKPAAAPPVATAVPPFDVEKFRAEQLKILTDVISDINKRTEGWSYLIPNFKYALMRKTMDDMLKGPDLPPPPPGNPLNLPIEVPN
jgi:hypothetical protein